MKYILSLFAILSIIIITSCATTHEPFHFVKVLGVTHAGDTVLIDVNSLRPRVYNTYQYRNSVPYYNYIPYNPQIIIRSFNKPNPRPVIITPVGPRPSLPIKPTSKPAAVVSNKKNNL